MPRGYAKKLKTKRIVGVSADPGTYRATKKPDHPALDYSILLETKGDRLVTVPETARASGYHVTKIYWMIKQGYIPHIYDPVHKRRLLALETAAFLRDEHAKNDPFQAKMWAKATDRKKILKRLERNEELRKRVIDGHAITKARKHEREMKRQREKRALKRNPLKQRPIYRKDPLTGELIVSRYSDNWSVNKKKREHNEEKEF
jgi:hypothetical protein